MKLLQQCFLFFIVVVILGHNLGNSQVSVYRTIGPTLVLPNLRHPQLSIKDEVLKLKDGVFFANFQTILPTCFIFTKYYS